MSMYADRPSSASPSLRQSGLGQVTQLTRMSQIRTSPKWTIGGRWSGESASRGNMIPGPGQYRTTRFNDLGRGGASFRFGTGRRDGDTRTRSDDGPGPGSYNPREVGSAVKVGFGSGRSSCDGASRRYSEPGPGHYNPPSSLGKTGKMFSMKSRHGPAGESSIGLETSLVRVFVEYFFSVGRGVNAWPWPLPIDRFFPTSERPSMDLWNLLPFSPSVRPFKAGILRLYLTGEATTLARVLERMQSTVASDRMHGNVASVGLGPRQLLCQAEEFQKEEEMEELRLTSDGAVAALDTLEAACRESVDHGGHWLCRARLKASELTSALSIFLRLLLVEMDPSSQLERPFRRVMELIDRHLKVTLCPDCVRAFVKASCEMTEFLQTNFEQDTVDEALESVYYPYHDRRLRSCLAPGCPPVSRAIALLQYWGGIPSKLDVKEVEAQQAPSEFLESLHFSSRAVHAKLMEKYENDDWVVETVCASLRRIRATNPDNWISFPDSPWVKWEEPLLAKMEESSRGRQIAVALLEASAAACCSSSSDGWWFPRALWTAMAARGEPCVLAITSAAATSAHNTAVLEEGAITAVEKLRNEGLTVLKDTCFSLATIPGLTELVDRRLRRESSRVAVDEGQLAGLREVLSSDPRAVDGLALWCQQQMLAVGVENVSDYAWELLSSCALPAALHFMASIPVLKVFLRSIGTLAVEVLERRGTSGGPSASLPGPLRFVKALVDTVTESPEASLSYNLFDVAALHTALSDWVFENVPGDWSAQGTPATPATNAQTAAGYTAMTAALSALEKRIHGDRPPPLAAASKPKKSSQPPSSVQRSDEDPIASLPSLPSSPDDWDTYTPSRSVGVLSVSSSSSSDEEEEEKPAAEAPLPPAAEEAKPSSRSIDSSNGALKSIAGALDRMRAAPSYRSFTNNRGEGTGKLVQSKLDGFLKPAASAKAAATSSSWHSTSRNSKVERAFANVWDRVAAKKTAPVDGAKHKVTAPPPPPPRKPRPVAKLAPSPKRATSGFAIPTGSAAVAKAEAAGKPPPMFESRSKPRRMKMERTKIKLTRGSTAQQPERKNGNAIEVEREHAVDDLHKILLCRDPFSIRQDTSAMLGRMGMQRGDRGNESFTSADDYVKWFRPALLYESAEALRRSLSSTEGSSLYWGIAAVKISRSSRKGKWATLTVKSQLDQPGDDHRESSSRSERRVETLSQGDLVLLVHPRDDGSSPLYEALLAGSPLTTVGGLVESTVAFGVVFKEDAASQQPGEEEEVGKFRSARIKIPFQSEEAPFGLSPQSPWSVGSFCQAVVLGSTTTSERECEALDWVLSNSTLSPLRDLLITPSVPVLRRHNTSDASNPGVAPSTDLNQAQARAVASAADVSSPITLVQGPPGTGKTKTIVAMVKTLLETTSKLVICAPSNAAVDELTSRILGTLLPPEEEPPGVHSVLRVGSYRRITREEVKAISLEELAKTGGREKESELRGQHRGQREGILAEVRKLDETIKELAGDNDPEVRADRGRVIVKKKELKEQLDKLKQRSSRALSRSRDEACKQLLGRARVVLGTLSSFGSNTITTNFVARDATCIIDEACQAIEPSALIPLKLRGVKRLVLVGDPQQLPATVVSMEAKALRYERSLFERLVDAGWQAHLLDEQYRMLPEIADFASREFYDGRLRTADSCRFPPSLGQPLRPLLFLDSRRGAEERGRGGTSLVNTEEAGLVGKMVEAMATRNMSIGVVTPYRQQAHLIKRIVSSGAEVDTVDAYQGQEKDIIIMSCVRSSRDGGIGFVADYRRLNVSLTRAKFALWIVGNAESLGRSSKVWGDLVSHCRERGSFVDAGRIQKRHRYADGDNGEPILGILLRQQQQVGIETSMPPGCPPEELTSVMWRNIPNRYTYEMLVQVMNQHGFEYGNDREYHSVYLPWDDYNKCNRGYAFINLTSRPVADRFMTIFNGYQWPRNTTRSSKTSCVTWATTQVKHFSFDDSPGEGQPDGHITDGRFRASSHCSTVVTDGSADGGGGRVEVPSDSPIHMVNNINNFVNPPPENTVFVGGLSPAINTADLKALMSRQFGAVIDCEVKRCRSTGKSRCFGFCSFEHSSSAVAAVNASNSALQGNPAAGGLLRHLGSSARVKHYEQVPRRSFITVDASGGNGAALLGHNFNHNNNGNTDDTYPYYAASRRLNGGRPDGGGGLSSDIIQRSGSSNNSITTSVGSSPTIFPSPAIDKSNGFESLLGGSNSHYTDELNLDCLRTTVDEQKREVLARAAYTSGGCYYLYAKDIVDNDVVDKEDTYQPWDGGDATFTEEPRVTTDPDCAQQ
ncbi:hypothetical protein FOZ62_027468 [Perkinsus olseni]|uniref:RRM domain-containing protein n=1 Tax=Perkinsus olseni TaxID=32597 RepID=A0A7J6UAL4_PEROL|nr:hypothetical protein FOZ62_027468 [Perkinsus olseni]